MFRNFKKSQEIWNLSNGYFDPTAGSIVNLYGMGPNNNIQSINNYKVDSVMQYVGLDKVYLNQQNYIDKANENVYIDFNAIAKGYAVDEIANFLKNNQIDNYLVEIGGEINASGTNVNKNKPWVIAIDMPRFDGDRSIYSTLELNNISLASSGTYRKFKIDSDGNRYAHIINPLSGYPSKTNILSVTVKTSSCIEADAYATALHTMSIDEIIEFFDKNQEISSLVIFENENNQLEELVLNDFY